MSVSFPLKTPLQREKCPLSSDPKILFDMTVLPINSSAKRLYRAGNAIFHTALHLGFCFFPTEDGQAILQGNSWDSYETL